MLKRFPLTLSLLFSLSFQILAVTPALTMERPVKSPPGKIVFEKKCALCHGAGALGTDKGPPLVDKVYAPSHHGDFSFHLAVRNGVRRHHWGYGDMPPIEGVDRAEVEDIIKYVRGLQVEGGIF